MGALFDGVGVPSTLGSLLRAFSWDNVRQFEAASRRLLAELARRPPVLPDARRPARDGQARPRGRPRRDGRRDIGCDAGPPPCGVPEVGTGL